MTSQDISAPPSTPPAPNHFVMLVAVDDSTFAEEVASAAVGFTRILPRVELHLVHVLEGWDAGLSALIPIPPDMRGNHQEQLENGRALVRRIGATIETASGTRVIAHLAAGPAWRAIAQMAANIDADLVLVGTHGRTGIGRVLLGSVAELVTRKSPCPVLVVRAKTPHTVPEIEPACVDCLSVQKKTHRAKLWCARHDVHHPRARLHYEMPHGFAEGATLIVT
jgi:nucleotide-binding universal stress UspA family protein